MLNIVEFCNEFAKEYKKNINSVVFIVAWLKDMFQSHSDFEDSVMSTL